MSVFRAPRGERLDAVRGGARAVKDVMFSACVSIQALLLAYLPSVAMATGDPGGAIQSGVSSATKQIYDIITAICLPIAVVCLAICAFKIFFGSQRAAEEAKSTALRIVIAIAIVYLAPLIIEQIGGWFSQSSSSTSIW